MKQCLEPQPSNHLAWQKHDWGRWPLHTYQMTTAIERTVRKLSQLRMLSFRLTPSTISQFEYGLTINEGNNTYGIEGESLDSNSVHSAANKLLGFKRPERHTLFRNEEILIESLCDATSNLDTPLTEDRLHRWHTGVSINVNNDSYSIKKGHYGQHVRAIRVVNDCDTNIKQQMKDFIDWFNKSKIEPTLVRSAIAVYWFVSISPYGDDSRKVSRLIGDLAIAQSERSEKRLYSLSSALKESPRLLEEYDRLLESCQYGKQDINDWICFFIDALGEACDLAINQSDRYLKATLFWDNASKEILNDRQQFFLEEFLEGDNPFDKKITHKIYEGIVNHSAIATNKRDLKGLLDIGLIETVTASGRNASYRLALV